MDEFLDLGFKVPEKCRSYSTRLKPSVVETVDNLLAGASRSILIESLLKKWIEQITARRRERDRRVTTAESVPVPPTASESNEAIRI